MKKNKMGPERTEGEGRDRLIRGDGAHWGPSWLKTLVPDLYQTELLETFKLAAPLMFSESMVFMIGFVSTVFCGHIGKTELASAALAVAVVNISGISVGIGLSLTCDTLISQTYGSGNLKRVGVFLQRGVLIMLLACFPCWAVLLNTEPVLLFFKQNPEVASIAQQYVHVFMPALPATFMYQLQVKYLQNQSIIFPQFVTGAVVNILNALINYVFVFPLDLGVLGSAAATAISHCSLAVILFVYINVRGLHKATWSGWSRDCLQEWWPFIKLAVPSMAMLCLEFWVFEIGGFLAGVISKVEVGAQSVLYQLNTVAFMIPLGLSAAASVRVGNALGAGNTQQAKLSSKVPVICGAVIASVVGAMMAILRNYIGHIFTEEQEIIKRVADVMLLFSFMHVMDAVAGVTGGVVRGAGKQKTGALCNLVGFYAIGLPVGVSLMFPAKMGIMGLWAGITVCVTLQSIFFISFLCRLDWQQAAKEAQKRAGVSIRDEVEMENGDSQEANEAEIPNSSQQPQIRPVLSKKQLLLRRGLALLLMMGILGVAIVAKMFLMRLLRSSRFH